MLLAVDVPQHVLLVKVITLWGEHTAQADTVILLFLPLWGPLKRQVQCHVDGQCHHYATTKKFLGNVERDGYNQSRSHKSWSVEGWLHMGTIIHCDHHCEPFARYLAKQFCTESRHIQVLAPFWDCTIALTRQDKCEVVLLYAVALVCLWPPNKKVIVTFWMVEQTGAEFSERWRLRKSNCFLDRAFHADWHTQCIPLRRNKPSWWVYAHHQNRFPA